KPPVPSRFCRKIPVPPALKHLRQNFVKQESPLLRRKKNPLSNPDRKKYLRWARSCRAGPPDRLRQANPAETGFRRRPRQKQIARTRTPEHQRLKAKPRPSAHGVTGPSPIDDS